MVHADPMKARTARRGEPVSEFSCLAGLLLHFYCSYKRLCALNVKGLAGTLSRYQQGVYKEFR